MENLTKPRPEIKQAVAAEQPRQARETTQKSPFLMPIILGLALFISGLSLYSGSRSQLQYNALLKEHSTLQASVQKLEAENKTLNGKISQIEKEKDANKSLIDGFRKERESLEFEIKKSRSKLSSTSEEKSYLEEILINKNKELEKLKQQAPLAASVSSGSANLDDLAARLAEKDLQIQALNEQNAILQSKVEKIYKTANDKFAALNEARSTLESALSDAKKTIDSEFNTIDLGSISVANQTSATPAIQAAQQVEQPSVSQPQASPAKEARRSPRTEGKILAINGDHGFVVIDMGKVDGITNKSLFQIKNKSGDVVGTLNVLEVRDVMTACSIEELKPGSKIEINDTVVSVGK